MAFPGAIMIFKEFILYNIFMNLSSALYCFSRERKDENFKIIVNQMLFF